MKNNVSRDLALDFRKNQEEQTFPDKYVMDISRRIMKKNKKAYKVLAKERG